MPKQTPVVVHGVWLRYEGPEDHAFGSVVVLVERNPGQWVEIIREASEGNYSHICEPNGIRHAAGEASLEECEPPHSHGCICADCSGAGLTADND